MALGAVAAASAEFGLLAGARQPPTPTTESSTQSATSQLSLPTETVTATDTTTRTATATQVQNQTITSTELETDILTSIQTQTSTQTSTMTATQVVTVVDVVTESPTQSQTQPEIQTETSGDTNAAYLPAGAFSVFWITDTQFLAEKNPELFNATTNWIVDNWKTYNGKFVIHTGDLVQDGNVLAEWTNADQAMSVLLENGIPYTWCAGNHDDLVGGDATSGWLGDTTTMSLNPGNVSAQMNAMPDVSWVSDYHQGMNTAATFSANGLDFLVVNLEWNAQPDALQWLEGILDDPDYADYNVIIAPHAYIDAFGFIIDESNGVDLSDFVYGLTDIMDKHSSNVFLTLNGHYATDSGYNTTLPINNRSELMFDRQDCTDTPSDLSGRGVDTSTPSTPDDAKVGGATVTILTFDTLNNQIDVNTYDVNLGQWRPDSYDQYSVPLFSSGTTSSTSSTSST